jgi:predicted MFS family arabinose efflux permease
MLTSMQRPSGITWLVAPGLAMIAVTYGLARFAYGLFLPEMRESLDLSESVLGLIGAGSYAGYCFAVLGALLFTSQAGPRFMAVAAGAVAVVGMATVAGAPAAWVLALGVLIAGSSSGLASPPMGEAVATAIAEESQDRANALINLGTSIGVALGARCAPGRRAMAHSLGRVRARRRCGCRVECDRHAAQACGRRSSRRSCTNRRSPTIGALPA